MCAKTQQKVEDAIRKHKAKREPCHKLRSPLVCWDVFSMLFIEQRSECKIRTRLQSLRNKSLRKK
ncbi:MAG TPA: hypothetical protein DCM08_10960 [Microscillaceae bacterium]|nr:hypothetical protein [Microscillaceae bacterium]